MLFFTTYSVIRQGDHYSLTNYSGSLVKKKTKKNIRMTKALYISSFSHSYVFFFDEGSTVIG